MSLLKWVGFGVAAQLVLMSVAAAEDVQGTLTASSKPAPNGAHRAEHDLLLQEGQSVRIRLSSSAFDPFLFVVTPSGELLSNDDASPSDRSAELSITASVGGRYSVMASSYETSSTGAYALHIDGAAPQSVAPQAPAAQLVLAPPVAPQAAAVANVAMGAGRNAQGKVVGVFIGIDDYANVNDLQGCVQDATELARSFQTRGLMRAEDARILTNSAATTQAVEAAIAEIAARATANDIFVFFYSGHGAQVAEAVRGNEADSMDETLVLYNGMLTDDSLRQMLDRVHADQTLVALDSCHSGGFARELEAANRLALMSSEEGILSDTAPQFNAGGYLAYWLRRAVDGETGTSEMRIGDLLNYLQRQYADNRNTMSTRDSDGFETDQRLVVARSSSLRERLWTAGPSQNAMLAMGGKFDGVVAAKH